MLKESAPFVQDANRIVSICRQALSDKLPRAIQSLVAKLFKIVVMFFAKLHWPVFEVEHGSLRSSGIA